MKKMIAIIVAAIFVFAMTSISLAAEEKVQATKPAEKTPAEAPKSVSSEKENLKEWGELKEEGNQDVFKELTPEEKEKLLEEFEKQEKKEFRNLKPEDIEWGKPEKPAGEGPELWPTKDEVEEPQKIN